MRAYLILAVTTLLVFCTSSAQAVIVVIDENGNGSVDGRPMTGSVETFTDSTPTLGDPLLPGRAVLVYRPGIGSMNGGDVPIMESGAFPAGVISDVMRFVSGRLILYSEFEPGETLGVPPANTFPSLSDVAHGGTFVYQGTPVPVNELSQFGGGDPNVASFTPIQGQPGEIVNVAVTYIIASDPAPEPASIILLACGITALGIAKWRQTTRHGHGEVSVIL
jgi:hypothetical protein